MSIGLCQGRSWMSRGTWWAATHCCTIAGGSLQQGLIVSFRLEMWNGSLRAADHSMYMYMYVEEHPTESCSKWECRVGNSAELETRQS